MWSEGTSHEDAPVNPGPKQAVTGLRAACSSDNRIVTQAALGVLRRGGNAIDAAIAACMVQPAIEPYMTSYTGTVTCLYYEAASGRFHQLDSAGVFPAGKVPFKPVPQMANLLGALPPAACIPGFMPGLKAMYERFATRPWCELCEEAVKWAEEGHVISSFEYGATVAVQDFITYFPEGRRFYMPGGFLTPVGMRFRNEQMAQTVRQVAAEGPDYMIEGEWAQRFIAKARQMGWPISREDMTATPPRWLEPLRFKHRDFDVVGLAPPPRQGVFCALVLGILEHVGYRELRPGSADALYYMAHALRWAEKETGYLHDPEIYDVPLSVWLDESYHRHIARIIKGSRPKVNLAEHTRLTWGTVGAGTFGVPEEPMGSGTHFGQPTGSCEISIVDAQGNWVQMMNTLQSGGIPGMVVDGVPMIGSHATFGNFTSAVDARLVKGARLRHVIGNTIVLKNGSPWISLGTPGNVYCTVPQVLANLLDFGMSPYEAADAPRMLPLSEDNVLVIEDRVDPATLQGLAALGIRVRVTPAYDSHMGSFQMCWRDELSGQIGTCADPRRCGVADGLR